MSWLSWAKLTATLGKAEYEIFLPAGKLAFIGSENMSSFTTAFLFPGQGSQAVGMGVALAASHQAAKHVFDEVNDALDENLFDIMTHGPDDLIRMTRNAQPALFASQPTGFSGKDLDQ